MQYIRLPTPHYLTKDKTLAKRLDDLAELDDAEIDTRRQFTVSAVLIYSSHPCAAEIVFAPDRNAHVPTAVARFRVSFEALIFGRSCPGSQSHSTQIETLWAAFAFYDQTAHKPPKVRLYRQSPRVRGFDFAHKVGF